MGAVGQIECFENLYGRPAMLGHWSAQWVLSSDWDASNEAVRCPLLSFSICRFTLLAGRLTDISRKRRERPARGCPELCGVVGDGPTAGQTAA